MNPQPLTPQEMAEIFGRLAITIPLILIACVGIMVWAYRSTRR